MTDVPAKWRLSFSAAWHMLSQRRGYVELGAQYLETLHRKEIERNLIRRLEKLGHRVILEPVA